MAQPDTLIGLMSGTSKDGIDAAAVRIWEAGGRSHIELLSFITIPYEQGVRSELLRCAEGSLSVPELARLNFRVGELLADAAHEAMDGAGLTAIDVLAVGSHGHTVAHLPECGLGGSTDGRHTADGERQCRSGGSTYGRPGGLENPPCGATLQIGEGAVIAERLGVQVACDFRTRDVAAGGQGAPLVPLFDYTFVREPSMGRAVLNIGGIANVTILAPGCEASQVLAFDIGPGNMPLDAAVRLLLRGGPRYDIGGRLAAAGTAQEGLVDWVLGHEFYSRPLPRSCGREEFGEHFVAEVLGWYPRLSPEDVLASLTVACGEAIGSTIAGFRKDRAPWEIIASGGGVHNATLMSIIARHAGMAVRTSDELGIPSDAKEAMAFAFLARECLGGRPGNVPTATGAAGPRVLGKIVPA